MVMVSYKKLNSNLEDEKIREICNLGSKLDNTVTDVYNATINQDRDSFIENATHAETLMKAISQKMLTYMETDDEDILKNFKSLFDTIHDAKDEVREDNVKLIAGSSYIFYSILQNFNSWLYHLIKDYQSNGMDFKTTVKIASAIWVKPITSKKSEWEVLDLAPPEGEEEE